MSDDVSLDFRKGEASKPAIWGVPWSCQDCKAWGYVPACAEEGRRTTDEQLMHFIGKKHRALSPSCFRAPERMLLGRARRRDDKGKLIFLLHAGEDEHTVIDVRWPLFDEGY